MSEWVVDIIIYYGAIFEALLKLQRKETFCGFEPIQHVTTLS
jgi:hypothetical protein